MVSTLGFASSRLLPVVRRRAPQRLVVFYDMHEKSGLAYEDVKAYCRSVGLRLDGHRVDAFAIVPSINRIRQEIRRAPRHEVLVAATGGTTILSCAALFASLFEGVRAVYLRERSNEEVDMPLLHIEFEATLSGPKRAIIKALIDAGGTASASFLAKKLSKTKATISYHVRDLVKQGIIAEEIRASDRRQHALTLTDGWAMLWGPDGKQS